MHDRFLVSLLWFTIAGTLFILWSGSTYHTFYKIRCLSVALFTIPAELLMIRLCRSGWNGTWAGICKCWGCNYLWCRLSQSVLCSDSAIFCIHEIYIRRKQYLRLTYVISMNRTVIIQLCQGKYSFPFYGTFNEIQMWIQIFQLPT